MIFRLISTTVVLATMLLISISQASVLHESQAEITTSPKANSAVSDEKKPKTMEASQLFGQNAADDGPITICSDTLSYNQQAHTIVYQGNVLVTQVKGINIQCAEQPLTQKNDRIPTYSFWESNNQSDYQMQQLAALKMIKPVCQKQQGCRFLAGQQLKIIFTEDNKEIVDVVVTTDPQHTAKFYTLPFEKKDTEKSDKAPSEEKEMYAEGEKMNFNFTENLLTIENNAYIERDGNQFSGSKVLYDTKNGLVTVPDTGKRATIVLNNNKQKALT